jgi:hypothetical protein
MCYGEEGDRDGGVLHSENYHAVLVSKHELRSDSISVQVDKLLMA